MIRYLNVTDPNGEIVAKAVISSATKTLTLTYTDYADKHSDIRGKIKIQTVLDRNNVDVSKDQKIPIVLDVADAKVAFGEVKYTVGPGDALSDFYKYGGATSVPNEIRYVINVNLTNSKVSNVVINDVLKTQKTSYVKDSFIIYRGRWGRDKLNHNVMYDAKQMHISPVFDDKNGLFNLNLGDIDTGYQIIYRVKVDYMPVNGEIFHNQATYLSNGSSHGNADDYSRYVSASGEANGYNYTISLKKVNEGGVALAGAIFNVIRKSNNASVGTITTGADGTGSLSGLLRDDYTLKEIKAPVGYDVGFAPIEVSNADFDSNRQAHKLVTDKLATTSVSGTKTWKDNDDQDGARPKEITVNLLANGKKVDSKKVTSADNWKYSFNNLPKYENGKSISYSVTEDAVPNYTTTYQGNDITNEHTPGKTSVTVTKEWKDENDKYGKRPQSIKVQLYANGVATDKEVTLSSANKWTYTWANLDIKKAGRNISYTVKETTHVSGYETSINNADISNIIITNTFTKIPTTSGVSTTPSKPRVSTTLSTKLPQTNAETDWILVIIGVIIIASVIVVYVKSHKKFRK